MKPNDFLNLWMGHIHKGEIESLLSLYNEQAVLIPTFSNRILDTPIKIREYFEKFGNKAELSIALHGNPKVEQKISDQIYCISGIYCWRFEVDGEMMSFEARFSYLLNFAEKSPIMHHHSSQVPRMI